MVSVALVLMTATLGGPEARFVSATPAGIVSVVDERGVFLRHGDGSVAWRASLPESYRIVCPAAGAADGRVFALAERGLVGLSQVGDIAWKVGLKLPPAAPWLGVVATADGLVIAPTGSHEVIAVRDGQIAWRYVLPPGAELAAALVIDREARVLLPERAHLTALAADGRLLWRVSALR